MYAESERIAASPPGKLYAANGCAHFAVEMIPRVPPHPIGGVLATPLSRVCGRGSRRGGGGRVRSSEDCICYQQQDLILRGERERERDVLKGERRRRRGVDVEREGREERERGSCDAHYIWFRFTRKTEQRRLMGPRCSYAQFEEFPFSARVSSRDIAITARQREREREKEREGGRELKRGETRRVRSVLSIKPS